MRPEACASSKDQHRGLGWSKVASRGLGGEGLGERGGLMLSCPVWHGGVTYKYGRLRYG